MTRDFSTRAQAPLVEITEGRNALHSSQKTPENTGVIDKDTVIKRYFLIWNPYSELMSVTEELSVIPTEADGAVEESPDKLL